MENKKRKNKKGKTHKTEAYIAEICIGGEDGGKVKLKPADGFGVKVPETDKDLIAFVDACGSGTLLSTDTYFEFPDESDFNFLLALKQQHVRLSVEIGANREKIVSAVIA